MKRTYGWKPDLPDHRDAKFIISLRGALPSSVDLRPECPPVVDQADLGSCTANALAGAFDYVQKLYLLNPVLAPEEYTKSFEASSRLFIYYNERVIEGSVNEDSGAQIRDGIKALAKQGCCPESQWPYEVSKFTNKPSSKIYDAAKSHRIKSYARIQSFLDLKAALALGFPIPFGFTVYNSFESAKVAKTGIVPMPKKSDYPVGGHAVLCVGYDDAKKCVIVRNSWGTSWGVKGYFFMPYDYVSNPDLCDDFWVIKI